MGNEFDCKFGETLPLQTIDSLLKRISTLPYVAPAEELDFQSHRISLRFKEHNEHSWPEDLAVKLTETRCYVVFHVGSDVMQREVIAAVEDLLAQAGYPCVLEEL